MEKTDKTTFRPKKAYVKGTPEMEKARYDCRRLRAQLWDMNERRGRMDAARWVKGHIGESMDTATLEELTTLKGYLAYKLEHGHCPIHENDRAEIRYKKKGGSSDARQRIKEKLIAMHGEKCVACGKTGVPLTLDHIKPIALGGKNELANGQMLCIPCHNLKTKTDSKIAYRKFFAEKFPEKLKKRREERMKKRPFRVPAPATE
jgi:5-methylcytosine-specific restriction endonuclease McrA